MVIGFFNFKNSSQREPSKTKCGPHFNSYARCACAKSLSPVQCPSLGAEQPQPARHGARASQARVLRLLSRERERSGALARAPLESRMCWRPRLARRRVLNRREQASRWCIVFSSSADRPQSARYGARASQARVVRLLPRESERSGALACAPRKSRLCVGGRSWQVAPSSCTEGDRPVAGAVPFHRIHADYNQRGTARVSRKLLCCASSPEIASAVARSCVRRAKAGCVFEASAATSQHGLVPKERGLWPVQCFFQRVRTDANQRGTARASQARVLRLLPRESERSGALACAPRKSWLCVGGHYWQVAPRSCTEGESPLAGTVPFHRVRANYHKRGAARARRKLAFCASSPETASAVVCSCARRARAGCVLEASAGHVAARSCTEEERRLADAVRFHRVQIDYNQRDTTFMRRKLACCASSRERASAVARSRVRHAKESPVAVCWRPLLVGRSLQGLEPKERAFSLAQCPFIGHVPTTTIAVRRAGVASLRAVPPPQKQLAQWRARVHAAQETGVCWRPRLARRSTVLYRRREASRRCSTFPKGTVLLQPVRYDVHASQARVLRLLPRIS